MAGFFLDLLAFFNFFFFDGPGDDGSTLALLAASFSDASTNGDFERDGVPLVMVNCKGWDCRYPFVVVSSCGDVVLPCFPLVRLVVGQEIGYGTEPQHPGPFLWGSASFFSSCARMSTHPERGRERQDHHHPHPHHHHGFQQRQHPIRSAPLRHWTTKDETTMTSKADELKE